MLFGYNGSELDLGPLQLLFNKMNHIHAGPNYVFEVTASLLCEQGFGGLNSMYSENMVRAFCYESLLLISSCVLW